MYFDEYQAKLAREREEWAKKAEQKHKNRMKSPAQGDTPPTSPGEDVHRPEFERAGSSSSTTLETRASHGPTAHTPIQDGSKPQYTRASSSDVSTRFQTANADTPSSPPPARPAAGQLSPPSPDKQTPGRPLPRLPQAGSSTSSAAAFVCPPPTPLTRTSYPFHPSPSPTANYMSYSPISPPMAGRSASVQWETLLNVSGEDGADVDPAALAEQMLSELRARNPEWEARRKEVLQRQRVRGARSACHMWRADENDGSDPAESQSRPLVASASCTPFLIVFLFRALDTATFSAGVLS